MAIHLDSNWQVRMKTSLILMLTPEQVWPHLSHFKRFVCIDLFHHDVRLESNGPCRGAAFILDHRLFWISIERIGRILWWQEGLGFAFSDLSKRGHKVGFPHMYSYRLAPDPEGCRLELRINGRWTARFLPRWLVLLWLHWVFAHIRVNLRQELSKLPGQHVGAQGASLDL